MKPGINYIGAGCGALIISEMGDKIFLMKRGVKSKNQIGYWSQPGGAIEFGEKAEEAVIREIKEELNVDIEIVKNLNYSDHLIKEENQHWLVINFLAKIKSGKPQIMEPGKCDEIGWFSFDTLPDRLTAPTILAIKSYLFDKSK